VARPSSRRRLAGLTAALLVPALLVPAAAQGSVPTGVPAVAAPDTDIVPDGPEPMDIVPVYVPDRERLDDLVATGVDVLEEVSQTPLGLAVQVYATPSEQARLDGLGFSVGEPVVTADEIASLQAGTVAQAAEIEAAEATALETGDDLRVQRAVHLGDAQGDFIEIEVWSAAGAESAAVILQVELDAGPGTEIGDGGTFNLSRFVDAGQYMFHVTNSPRPVPAVPSRMRVTSLLDGEVLGTAEASFERVFDDDLPNKGPGTPIEWGDLATGFVDHYVDPVEAYSTIEELAAEFPDLAEIIELPNPTGGYQRRAMHLITGVPTSQSVGVTSHAWGHEGGDDISIAYVNPGAPSSPLAVTVDGTDVTVSLGTDANGALASTAAQVVAAINASAASDLLYAYTYRGNAGAGITPAVARTNLDDFLNAPDSIERGPYTQKVLRIGRDRDGSKTGVFLYSQEHAREWVTPITALETAQRLLRNYESNDAIKRLVNNLDIFILPVTNPDGATYSMYDNTGQRRNLTNYCPVTGSHDANARNAWGVDVNRNFRAGSRFDGYSGASASCTSDTFSGPAELSEPEARNEVWLVDNHPNIKFSMNTHTHGGYFMWAPGSYITPGRITNERPSMGVESYFYESSDHILSRIEDHRGTVLWPSRVGPIADVLYSAAGNSADDFYYNYGIFGWSFEAGAPRWDGDEWDSVGFTPPVAEGIEEAMEFSHGWLGILEVAYRYSKDTVRPSATLTPGGGTYDGPVEISFDISEPANVYYTLDGSRPTYDSPRLAFEGPRQGIETITVSETTTVKWFAVDMKGNVSNNYRPEGNARNYSSATITIE
jgi:Zinc carboxypeptidase/Chitobiase/beta-hexosaminidase C-terminal domain